MNEEKKRRKIDNFEEYLKFKGITENKATKDCKLAQGLLGNARKNELYDLGYVSIDRILKRYTDLSEKFLLYGEGPMILNTPRDSESSNEKNDKSSCMYSEEEYNRLQNEILELTTKLNVCNKEIELLKGTIEFMKNLVKHNG